MATAKKAPAKKKAATKKTPATPDEPTYKVVGEHPVDGHEPDTKGLTVEPADRAARLVRAGVIEKE